jgi:nitroreductase
MDNIDHAQVDAVLTTTRAVRRRLDFSRSVDNDVLLECIDIAEQAPTGANLASRRWIIVRDQVVKDALAEHYRRVGLASMSAKAERVRGTGHPYERLMASAIYLAEHLAEVPAIVIPAILGRYDNSGRPSLFDSVIQAAWSFCLALRARGLGTAWVTASLRDEASVKEILGTPENLTEIALLPVAYTMGTDFRRASRSPARSITSFDRYGTTFERGPLDGLRFEEGPGTIVEVDIGAPLATIWALVTNINVLSGFSTELLGAEWENHERGVGAIFRGRNQHPTLGEGSVRCFVDARDEPRQFGWRTGDVQSPGARWRFELEPTGDDTRLRFAYVIGPGRSAITLELQNNPGKEADVLRRSIAEVRATMQRAVEGIKQLAEASQ